MARTAGTRQAATDTAALRSARALADAPRLAGTSAAKVATPDARTAVAGQELYREVEPHLGKGRIEH